MTEDQIKTAALAKLADAGLWLDQAASWQDIRAAIERTTGGRWDQRYGVRDFVRVYVSPPVPGREPPVFRRIKPENVKPHWRAADIDAGQPPMRGMRGVGNGVERVHGYARGR